MKQYLSFFVAIDNRKKTNMKLIRESHKGELETDKLRGKTTWEYQSGVDKLITHMACDFPYFLLYPFTFHYFLFTPYSFYTSLLAFFIHQFMSIWISLYNIHASYFIYGSTNFFKNNPKIYTFQVLNEWALYVDHPRLY